jgi:glycosyltransferase involved in cell wall biosynthesis
MGQLDEPVVDVGIPTRDRPRFLREAVESVLAQRLTGWRLTVRENGPGSEESRAAVEPYLADPRVRHAVNGEDVGQAANHTLLLADGTAPYVAILHDDDRWAPEFLRRRVAMLDAHPEVGLVFGGAVNVDESGRRLSDSDIPFAEGIPPAESLVELLYQYNCIGVPSRAVVRRAAYEAVGPRFDDRFLFWDWEMWFRIAARFPVGYVPYRDVEYRVHGGQMTFAAHYDRQQMLRFLDHVEAVVRRDLPNAHLPWRMRSRKRAGVMLSAALDAVESGQRLTAAKALSDAVKRYPMVLVDPRVPVLLATLPFGARAAPLLARLRAYVLRLGMRRGIRIHRHR